MVSLANPTDVVLHPQQCGSIGKRFIKKIILLVILTRCLDNIDDQLGFKKGHYTDHCMFV